MNYIFTRFQINWKKRNIKSRYKTVKVGIDFAIFVCKENNVSHYKIYRVNNLCGILEPN